MKPPNHDPLPKPRLGARGFTLVELLTAAILLFIAVVGIVGITRKGRAIDTNDKYRRAARSAVMARFESPQFQFIQYENLKLLGGGGPLTQAVTLDDRNTPGNAADDLAGTLTIAISGEQTLVSQGITVPYIAVDMRVVWNELQGPETLALSKQISQ